MQKTRIVILGGGYSGVMAAGRLAHKLRGQAAEITLVNALPDFVQRIRLHQLAADQSPAKASITKLLKGTGVNFVQARVTQLNPQSRSLTVQTPQGDKQPLNYDYLIYALGSYVDTSRVDGVQEYALSLGSEAASIELRDKLPAIAQRGGRLVIVGGGLTGIESAAELAEAYPTLKVTLITRGLFGEELSQKGRKYLQQTFERLHIKVIDNASVKRISADEVHYEGGTLAYDACLWSGAFTVSDLPAKAGLQVNDLGQITVDNHLRSVSHQNIYAVGDAADVSEAIGTPIRMACATALPMGAYAADELAAHISGSEHRPHEFAYVIRCISLGRSTGLVQMVEADDRPKEQILSGRVGALVKEIICRYTFWQVQNPRWMYFTRRPATESRAHTAQAATLTS